MALNGPMRLAIAVNVWRVGDAVELLEAETENNDGTTAAMNAAVSEPKWTQATEAKAATRGTHSVSCADLKKI